MGSDVLAENTVALVRIHALADELDAMRLRPWRWSRRPQLMNELCQHIRRLSQYGEHGRPEDMPRGWAGAVTKGELYVARYGEYIDGVRL